jgi:acyl carrier protein
MDEQAAREIIADHTGVPKALVVDSAGFRDLGADSLDLISLTMRFEEAFNVEISDEAAHGCSTVGDALEVLRVAMHLRHEAQLVRTVSGARGWA